LVLQREHTPSPPTYQALTSKPERSSRGLKVTPTGDFTKDQAFYRPRLVETPEEYRP